MNEQYTYQSALVTAEGIRWRVEDLIGGEKRLDFTKPFLPRASVQRRGSASRKSRRHFPELAAN